jgi:ribonuclease HepT-like protein
MSDARWIEVESDVDGAVRHFERAVALFEAGGFDQPGLAGYRAAMAFMHAMQAAHTSLENGLLRILQMLGEEPPIGAYWHADLIRRVARDLPGLRPMILPVSLAEAADETRRFRNIAARGYDSFDQTRAGPAVRAATVLAAGLGEALRVFRDAMNQD